MAGSFDDVAVLDELQGACRSRGYGVRQAPFFAPAGLCIFKSTGVVDGICVIERGVYVFPKDGAWHVLINWHNAPQVWTKRITNTLRLTAVVAAIVEGHDSPPTGWTQA